MIDPSAADEESLLAFPFSQNAQNHFFPHSQSSSSNQPSMLSPLHHTHQSHPLPPHQPLVYPSIYTKQLYGNHPRYSSPLIDPAASSNHHLVSTNTHSTSATASPLPVHSAGNPQSFSAYTTAPPHYINPAQCDGTTSPLQPRAPPNLFMDSGAKSTNDNENPRNLRQYPFGYVPSVASTVPVNENKRRTTRRTSKRSVEELILESNIPTGIATTMGPIPPPRPGPSVGLLATSTFPNNMMQMPQSMPAGPTLPLSIPEPPLATATPSNPNALKPDPQPRPKKKSKYSSDQDALILRMKKEGRPWSDISEAAKCGNSIAARNRYQVLIGQQGGGAVVWDSEDTAALQRMLEDGEKAKWNFIANELSRVRSKKASRMACQRKIKELFDGNPAVFGIVLNAPQLHYGGMVGSTPANTTEFQDLMGSTNGTEFGAVLRR